MKAVTPNALRGQSGIGPGGVVLRKPDQNPIRIPDPISRSPASVPATVSIGSPISRLGHSTQFHYATTGVDGGL